MDISSAVIFLGYVAGICALFSVGGFIADYIFPHIGFLNRWIDSHYEKD